MLVVVPTKAVVLTVANEVVLGSIGSKEIWRVCCRVPLFSSFVLDDADSETVLD